MNLALRLAAAAATIGRTMQPSLNPAAPVAELSLRGYVRRGLQTFGICLVVAAVLVAMDHGRVVENVVYSVCIGMSCWLLIDVCRALIAHLARSRYPQTLLATYGWPGWLRMSLIIVVGVALGFALGVSLADLVLGNPLPALRPSRWRAYLFALTITVVASVVSTYFFKTRETLASVRAEAEAARRVAAEHQLKLLESQLEPHMLFNTLANLRALIAVDPPRAQAMLDRLIGFLRATLNASRVGMHPLAAEFERLADYLALMQVRMGERLQIELDLPDALASRPIPALLLQPLVENAIKHGLEPHRGGGRVSVRASKEADGRLRLAVHNTGAALPEEASPAAGQDATGFGTTQVRERLATLYGSAASFTLAPAPDGGTLAVLLLPEQTEQKATPA
jgi:sensor histidine kinase YesM